MLTAKTIKRNSFTLIEMIVAMAILSLLMLLLFRFLAAGQDVWSRSQTNTRIYENARVAMELIQRELKTAVASDLTDREIPFYGGDSTSNTVFVAATSLTSSSQCKLSEVTYYLDGNVLKRYCVSADSAADWDFHGQTTDGWQNSAPTGGQTVIGGVESFSLNCFDADANPVSGTVNSLPAYVQMSITLFDEELTNELSATARENRIDQSKRTFTRTVYLKQD